VRRGLPGSRAPMVICVTKEKMKASTYELAPKRQSGCVLQHQAGQRGRGNEGGRCQAACVPCPAGKAGKGMGGKAHVAGIDPNGRTHRVSRLAMGCIWWAARGGAGSRREWDRWGEGERGSGEGGEGGGGGSRGRGTALDTPHDCIPHK
jgi:hypothetical protein